VEIFTLQTAIEVTDRIIFDRTHRHLDNLQRAIIAGAWERKKYEEIADQYFCSEGHVKDVGYELWGVLSQIFDEKVSKNNFRSVLERHGKISLQNVTDRKSDFSQIIDDAKFFGREEELDILKKWISKDLCKLINIFGIGGIGKTSLGKQLVKLIGKEFQFVIWRSLLLLPTPELFFQGILNFMDSEQLYSNCSGLMGFIQLLRDKRCLIVIDDVQSILNSKSLAGGYQDGFESYGDLIKWFVTEPHQSCLILIGWEKPKEVVLLEGVNKPTRSLQLNGLDIVSARSLFTNEGLAFSEDCDELSKRYQGHPLVIKLAARMIKELFSGSITMFLENYTLFLGDLSYLLSQQISRLASIELEFIEYLARNGKPIALSEIKFHFQNQCSIEVILKVLESLSRKSLLEKVESNEGSCFTLQPIVMKYIKQEYVR
jgi:hypothetical protein